MGRQLVSGVDAPHQAIGLVAETELRAGDYVKVGGGGYARRAADGVPLALQNSLHGVTALIPAALVDAGGGPWGRSSFSTQFFRSVLALDNGQFAVVYSGNGSQADTGVNLRLYNPMRVPVSPRVVVASATVVVGTRLARAGGDNIAVAWTEGAVLKLAIHSASSGAVVASETTVATLASSDVQGWNLAAVAGGDFVLAYGKSGGNDLVFRRYNATGVLQGGETVVEAGASPAFVGVLALKAGGFVVHHYRYASGTAYKFARFAADGTQQGALTTLAAGSPNRSVSPSERNAMELTNGHVVFVDPSSNTNAAVRLYDAAGNYLSTLAVATGAAGMPNTVCMCPRQFGGFWLTVGGQLYEYDNAGNTLRQSTMATTPPFMLFDRAGTGPLMAVHTVGSGFTTHLYSWNADLSAIESTLVLSTSSSYPLSYAWTEVLSSGMLVSVACGQPSSGAAQLNVTIPQASSILGIAQEAALPGAMVRVATAGKFTTTQSFTSSAFDRRSATPPGTRGVAIGNTAILGGLSD